MATYINSFILFMVLLLLNGTGPAQSSKPKQTERHYEGLWVDKKTTRHLEISFKDGYATIIDWTSKFQKRESGDSYKAFLKNGKLIMPEDREHHAAYSEIIAKDQRLIYLTKSIGAGKASTWDRQSFTRARR
ncbi:hypothetical protein SAMN04487898_103154 [Pedobacter sp. ok626]|uniref:hypothetical protein n=1 Tax=Pedobacter sp. ok626 TaxID=1761882 RepID=UPI00088965D7|nr:hypothetical protein [Pedobacter sp. ok626]SDJ52290.1 hypothetical protein SAMN04487898_103154 [Pedobacter sp. ok626]